MSHSISRSLSPLFADELSALLKSHKCPKSYSLTTLLALFQKAAQLGDTSSGSVQEQTEFGELYLFRKLDGKRLVLLLLDDSPRYQTEEKVLRLALRIQSIRSDKETPIHPKCYYLARMLQRNEEEFSAAQRAQTLQIGPKTFFEMSNVSSDPPLHYLQSAYEASLFDWIEELPSLCGKSCLQFYNYMRQIVEQLTKIHAQEWAHGDIKPENMLLMPRTEKATLSDFSFLGGAFVQRCACGTWDYLPPEAILRIYQQESDADIQNLEALDRRSWDIWALGIVFYFAFSGGGDLVKTVLGSRKDDLRDVAACKNKAQLWDERVKCFCSILKQDVGTLIQKMCTADPLKRPSIKDVAEELANLTNKTRNKESQ